jgi:hypothetical protein
MKKGRTAFCGAEIGWERFTGYGNYGVQGVEGVGTRLDQSAVESRGCGLIIGES